MHGRKIYSPICADSGVTGHLLAAWIDPSLHTMTSEKKKDRAVSSAAADQLCRTHDLLRPSPVHKNPEDKTDREWKVIKRFEKHITMQQSLLGPSHDNLGDESYADTLKKNPRDGKNKKKIIKLKNQLDKNIMKRPMKGTAFFNGKSSPKKKLILLKHTDQ